MTTSFQSIDRPSRQSAVLVCLRFKEIRAVQKPLAAVVLDEELAEFQALAHAAGFIPTAFVTGHRTAPDAQYFVGRGKVAEIQEYLNSTGAAYVLFNHDLTPRQERNLARQLTVRIMSRTALILDIFAQHARTNEGKLQVSLAQLSHLSTRLVRSWTHLERQRGGIGLRGGPGETQLEIDRRLIRTQMKTLQMKLDKLKNQRQQNRRRRSQSQHPLVALVGYTNTGKSTLFNQLTGADVLIADQVFATLDSTLRRFRLPNGQMVILADTVGFIRALPHELIEAFQGTLEETHEADLLLHIVDASHPNRLTQIQEVQAVLSKIHAQNIPQLFIYNKVDRLEEPLLTLGQEAGIDSVFLSAKTGEGIAILRQALMHHLASPTMRSKRKSF